MSTSTTETRSARDREISASNVRYLRDEITQDEHRAEVADICKRYASLRADLVDELEQPGDVTTAARDTAERVLDELETPPPARMALVDAASYHDRRTIAETISSLRLELEELRELAEISTVTLYRAQQQAAARLERMRGRPAGSHKPEKIEEAEQELANISRALELARKHNPTRRAILEKFS